LASRRGRFQAADEPALERLPEVGSSVETAIVHGRGLIVKRLDDGVMASFLTALDAVRAVDAGTPP